MRNILKNLIRPREPDEFQAYAFPDIEDVTLPGAPAEEPPAAPGEPGEPEDAYETGDASLSADLEDAPDEETSPIAFAQVQADAIIADARREAAQMLDKARAEAQTELEHIRAAAHEDGYRAGYNEGLSQAAVEAKAEREAQAQQLAQEVQSFLESAARTRDGLIEELLGELRDLAVTVAEKVIRISLKSSSEVISRMILSATEKLKRREWVHIYISGCDAKGMAQASPTLTSALAAVSDHVKIVPMADDESGTCIIEMPDEIIDASAGTQLSNIRDILAGASIDASGQNLL